MCVAKFFNGILLTCVFLFVLSLYLNNELNRHLFGIISDSFWLTGLSVLYLNLLTHLLGIRIFRRWFKIRQFEYSSRIYEAIGVRGFKNLLRKNPVRLMTRRLKLDGKSISDIEKLTQQLEESEQAHVFGFVLNIILAVLFGSLRDIRFAVWLSVFNIVLNLYPILVQRYNRNRIRIMIQKHHLR